MGQLGHEYSIEEVALLVSPLSTGLVEAERHFAVVKKNEVLALVGDVSLEVCPHNAVPCRAVLSFKLRLLRGRTKRTA